MSSHRFTAVVGMAADRAIGKDGTMPWRLPEDLRVFKELTMGHPILMGRKTFESIGRPLPGRQNIVLTRDATWSAKGVTAIQKLEQLEQIELQDQEIMVIGGAEIYTLLLPYTSKIYVSLIEGEWTADTYFPEFSAHFPCCQSVQQYTGFELLCYER